jgi:integrase
MVPACRAARDAGGGPAPADIKAYAADYIPWITKTQRSGRKEAYRVQWLMRELGGVALGAITQGHVERVRDRLLESGRRPATVNRYRAILSAMFKRAKRLGLVAANPVTGSLQFREAGQRLVWLHVDDEPTLLAALPPVLRPAALLAIHTGLRWSEQATLDWRAVDLLTGQLAVIPPRETLPGKEVRGRHVPLNDVARAVLFELAARRTDPEDAGAKLFPLSYRRTHELFAAAVVAAQVALKADGRDPSRSTG